MKEKLFNNNLSREVWRTKYQYKNESSLETFKRVASSLASVEKKKEYWYEKFLNTLVKFGNDGEIIGLKCTTGGRITANAGTEFKSASMINCYGTGPVSGATLTYERSTKDGYIKYPVKIVTEESPDSMANIVLTLMEQALTLGSEGGWGFNPSFIRPRGSIVKGIGVEHPGVVKFLEIFDKMAEVIVSGNNDGYTSQLKNVMTDEELKRLNDINNNYGIKKKFARKGAMMSVLDVSHPDIEEYVTAKQTSGILGKFNLSVLVTDEFMNAVLNDEMFELKFNGVVYKKVRAVDLYNLIMKSTYNRAEPGILFHGNMQKNNPLSYLGEVTITNPCGEIGINAELTTTCLLGSINITQYVNNDRTFDYELFENDIKTFTRMLDNVNDIHNNDLPSYLWALKNLRQIGMGINGFGSALYMLGIRYGSKESIEFSEKINRIKLNTVLKTSALLAKEKGTFPIYDKEKHLNTNYFKVFLKGKLDDDTIKLIEDYGLRNGKVTTNPPLGNSAVLCNNVSNGVEPVFTTHYERTYIADKWPDGINKDNIKGIFDEVKLDDNNYVYKKIIDGIKYYYEPHNRGMCIIEDVYDYGYKWVKENTEETMKEEYFVTTNDLSVDEHLNVQLSFQKYIDQSVSKTVNLKNSYPFKDFKRLYMDAWKIGLNGITTYRDGTMESVLTKIETKEYDNERHIIRKSIKMPNVLINGDTIIIRREGIKFYIHFSYFKTDTEKRYPVALWINTNYNYKGEAIYVNRAVKSLINLLLKYNIPKRFINDLLNKIEDNKPSTKLAKSISACLRHNLPIESIVVSLTNIEGDNVSSLLTSVRKFLGDHIEDGSKAIGYKCPSCWSTNVIFEAGCTKCLDCGASNCG